MLHGVEIAAGVPLVIMEKKVLRVTQYSAEAECLEVCYAAAEWIPLRFWKLVSRLSAIWRADTPNDAVCRRLDGGHRPRRLLRWFAVIE